MRVLLFTALFVLLFPACKKDHAGCFDSAGKETTSTRILQGFKGLDVSDKFDVYIVQDTSSQPLVTITAGQNVLTGISTEVKDSVLYIKDENRCKFVRDMQDRIKVEVRMNTLSYIRMIDAAKVFITDSLHTPELLLIQRSLEDASLKIYADFVDVRGYNSGAITLTGRAKVVAASIEDVCIFNSMDMDVNDMYIYLYGRKDAFVDGKKILAAYIYNTSNIYYKTPPEIDLILERHGSGNLIKQ